MKTEGKLLKNKAIDSLLLSIEHFNSIHDRGRLEAVLILLDHAFEMLLKGAILYKGGRIRRRGENNTLGFDACVRLALSHKKVGFLTDDQVLVLQTINGLRDAAQHHLLNLSEGQLYIHTQSGVTLFKDILEEVFSENLAAELPNRALPISTIAPADLITLFTSELDEVKALLAPGRRSRPQAEAKLRGLVVVDSALQGQSVQPGHHELRKASDRIIAGDELSDVFPGISSVEFTTEGEGMKINLRIATKEGIPAVLVPEGTPGATVIGVKRVDELGFYNMGRNQLAETVGLGQNKTTAAIQLLNLKQDPECYKRVVIGKSKFDRYSKNAIKRIRTLLREKTENEIWNEYRANVKSG